MSATITESVTMAETKDQQQRRKAQRARNVAIGIALAAFVVILYVATWAKLGANVLNRPL